MNRGNTRRGRRDRQQRKIFRLISRIGAKLRDRLGVPGVAETDEPTVLASLPSSPEAARFYTLRLT
jgi:hypothetical protein